MVRNRLLLGSVAFSVSFVLSLFVNRDIKTALLTGLITVFATFVGVVAVNRKKITQQKLILNKLEIKIYQLERWETQLNQSLLAITSEKQRTETTINFLKTELSQLYTQIAEQRSYKQQLSQDLIALSEHRRQLEAESHDLQTQVQNCEQRRTELHNSLRSIKAEKQNAEASVNSISVVNLEQLQVQIIERQHQKEKLERDIVFLNSLKPQLEEKLHNLRNQIPVLEKSQAELTQSVSVLLETRQRTEISVNSLQAEFNQLQTQIADKQNKKGKVAQELISVKEKSHLEVTDEKQIEKLPDEWTEFMMRLPKYELQVLKALVEQNNPSATIKKIAEENITMPELLIDLINKRALNTIGDLIIKPGSESAPPGITEEYLTNVNKLTKIKERN